uniref:Coronin n=1 Tax=Strix occidentalis caurina TaxID=311401 RepID=A0A8D0F3G2_STROC
MLCRCFIVSPPAVLRLRCRAPPKQRYLLDVGFPSPSQAWIGGIRAGSGASCGNHVKASCRWVAFNAEAAGVLGIVPLECKDGGKRTVSQLCCHSDAVTDFDFSPFDQLLLATGSADETVKVWRLPESGQDMPSGAGLTLGPGGGPVDVLQFHPTADGILASGAGKQVTVWDVGQQQPLTALDSHGDQLQSLAWKRDGRLLGTSCKVSGSGNSDSRVSCALQSVMGHENNKDSRLLWMGSSDCLISVGFSQVWSSPGRWPWHHRDVSAPLPVAAVPGPQELFGWPVPHESGRSPCQCCAHQASLGEELSQL